jgi:pilus assembly protein Flp/PilA
VSQFYARALAAFTVNGLRSLRRDEGQTLVEYALILVTISIGVLGAMTFLKGQINTIFSTIGNDL